tara:strand:+ start:15617 stop:15799 length:183 start_codon:yes stop_codon:yes gene_type:complete
LGEQLVYRGVKDGSIPAIKVGARYVILLEAWERKGATHTPALNDADQWDWDHAEMRQGKR